MGNPIGPWVASFLVSCADVNHDTTTKETIPFMGSSALEGIRELTRARMSFVWA